MKVFFSQFQPHFFRTTNYTKMKLLLPLQLLWSQYPISKNNMQSVLINPMTITYLLSIWNQIEKSYLTGPTLYIRFMVSPFTYITRIKSNLILKHLIINLSKKYLIFNYCKLFEKAHLLLRVLINLNSLKFLCNWFKRGVFIYASFFIIMFFYLKIHTN